MAGKVTLWKFPKSSGRNKRWRAQYTEKGKLKAAYFGTKIEADGFKNRHEREFRDYRKMALSEVQRQEYFHAEALCKANNKSLLETVKAGLDALPDASHYPVKLPEAIELYLINCQKRKLRDKTIKGHEHVLQKFSVSRGNTQVCAIKGKHIKLWIEEKVDKETSRKDYKRVFSSFFNWCSRQETNDLKWCPESIVKEVRWEDEVKSSKNIKFLSVEQAEAYIHAAPDKLKAATALGLFVGIRTYELQRMHWCWEEDNTTYGINFNSRQIHISADWAKTRERDLLENLPDNLWAWLEQYRRKSGAIVPMNYRNYCEAAKKGSRFSGNYKLAS